jgi:hypothetical protein
LNAKEFVRVYDRGGKRVTKSPLGDALKNRLPSCTFEVNSTVRYVSVVPPVFVTFMTAEPFTGTISGSAE